MACCQYSMLIKCLNKRVEKLKLKLEALVKKNPSTSYFS